MLVESFEEWHLVTRTGMHLARALSGRSGLETVCINRVRTDTLLCSLGLTRAFNAILGAWPGRSCGAGAVLQVSLRNVQIFKKDCGCGGFWGYNYTKKHPRATRFWERRDQ